MYFYSSYCCNFPATLSSISHSLLNWLSIHTGIPFRSTQAEFLIISTLNLSYNSSNLFGTFLTNNLSERRRMRVRERTRSIWGYLRWVVDKKRKDSIPPSWRLLQITNKMSSLRSYPSKFRNFLFVRREEVLWPRCEVTLYFSKLS